MTKPMKIDFISDVVCPWCIIGLGALEQALANASDVIEPEIHFHPFELNPNMPPEGQNVGEHVAEKYGATPEQSGKNRAMIRERAAEVGFTMNTGKDSRIYNTFDAHRLLHWAGLEGRQSELKHALFEAYFTNGQNPGDYDVLVAAAEKAGLDPVEARDVLENGRFEKAVRVAEEAWRGEGVSAVPTIVINDKYLITGGQPAAVFERALRRIAAEG
jgi:predicted DsbA family dithiol-disulfide isomerase